MTATGQDTKAIAMRLADDVFRLMQRFDGVLAAPPEIIEMRPLS